MIIWLKISQIRHGLLMSYFWLFQAIFSISSYTTMVCVSALYSILSWLQRHVALKGTWADLNDLKWLTALQVPIVWEHCMSGKLCFQYEKHKSQEFSIWSDFGINYSHLGLTNYQSIWQLWLANENNTRNKTKLLEMHSKAKSLSLNFCQYCILNNYLV